MWNYLIYESKIDLNFAAFYATHIHTEMSVYKLFI